ncbi:Sensor histidine kinase WalK [Roseovarius sp. EC-HK134]|uniref:sensor histidine kinase n=1 Tax=Roseovarius TaxID=74030 RepID=UPI0012583FE1|nr:MULTISPECIES: HAMP domain-containing sensor histidine kinase [Roseovarius]MBW4972068.1 HAMP domain-containing histidine kinase [Roseovarius mucosus]VVT31649.1 Sensor histidine kinase WalK [Roseovarius sp. EC-HK134]VVT32150.1 Sensor histidine kinase WalK [Roseovarius sp. EC-SD190]
MLNSLSGRFLILTAIFVMLAEILIFVPSIARFREDYLLTRLERSQIASLVLLADEEVTPDLQEELLRNAEVFNVVLLRDDARQLILSSPVPEPVAQTFDLRDAPAITLIRDAMMRLVTPERQIIRVIGEPVRMGGMLIEITLDSSGLRAAMIDYGLRILWLSLVISIFTAVLLFLAVRVTLVKPIKRVVAAMQTYAAAPEDVRRVLRPTARVKELREAEETLQSLQTQLTGALKQKEHLAQLGGAVAKVNHDLRNILTSAQLFTDRIETSEDPTVKRLAPKLINALTRAVHLCEATLAYGKAEEPGPVFARLYLADVVADVIDSERLAAGDADVSFAEDVPGDLVVLADAEQLYRIIGNLVRNARQAIVNSGRPGEISVMADEDAAEWMIRVADTGPGLPRRAREHLFKPFQGGTTKGGSGLGLTIAAELVRGHGGTLILERSDATGTAFCITLPKGNFGATS